MGCSRSQKKLLHLKLLECQVLANIRLASLRRVLVGVHYGLRLGEAGVPRPVYGLEAVCAGVLASQQEAGQLGAGQRGQQPGPVTSCLPGVQARVAEPALR